MNMTIQPQFVGDSPQPKSAKRTVKCAMAWQLDCVACGVVPMDSDHVAVLGLVSNAQSDIELQVISRTNGTVVQSDLLPLAKPQNKVDSEASTLEFILSSSFSTPRMEDSDEAEEEEYMNEEAIDFDIQNVMDFASSSLHGSSNVAFTDQHLKWNIKSYKDAICCEIADDEDSSLESGDSEYSDDYTFLFRPKPTSSDSKILLWQSPIMVITSAYDAVLVQTRDVDDSIEHAKMIGNHGLALRRGLDHRQIIRRHSLNELIDEYFEAMLFEHDQENLSLLTIGRLKSAAKATEILFGGNVDMWGKWIHKFAKIPGALFLLRPYIPTRGKQLSILVMM